MCAVASWFGVQYLISVERMTAFQKSDDLDRAIDALTVQAVWAASPGLPPVPRAGNVLVKSPFREDRNKSFSICFKGRGWKDQATGDKGGIWEFAKRATGKDGKELADWLIELSGIPRTPVRRTTDGGGQTTEEPFKPLRRMKPKPFQSPAVKAMLAEQQAKALVSRVEVRDVPAWSGSVEARWRTGAGVDRERDLALSRGWPAAWVEALAPLDLIAWPLLPWYDSIRERASELGVAFRVDLPVFVASNRSGMSHEPLIVRTELRPVGYHQRFEIRGEKSWVYVPYLKPPEDCRSAFQRQLRAEALAAGAADDGGALVPGLPFVLPGGAECTTLVITEGQWDAITFAGACGWFDSDTAWPEGHWVMGARGSNGADTLLAYWGPWLKRWRPRVLVLADNDDAGLWWDHAHMAGEREPWTGAWEPGVMPSFKEKLLAIGCPQVEVRRVNAAHGKDFNDYWKAKRPTPAAMAKWLGGVFDTKK